MSKLTYFLQGRFMNHPLHPAVVHLPIGLWMASFVFDIVYLASANPIFASISYYCIGLGIIGALLAAPLGLAEYVTIPVNTRPKRIATIHMLMNLGIVGLYLVNFLIRNAAATDAGADVPVAAFILSFVSVLMLSYSGYLGGLLVYEHGIGRRGTRRDYSTEVSSEGPRRAA